MRLRPSVGCSPSPPKPSFVDARWRHRNEVSTTERVLSFSERHEFAKAEALEIFGRVWKWVIIGVGLGAALHGFVPEVGLKPI